MKFLGRLSGAVKGALLLLIVVVLSEGAFIGLSVRHKSHQEIPFKFSVMSFGVTSIAETLDWWKSRVFTPTGLDGQNQQIVERLPVKILESVPDEDRTALASATSATVKVFLDAYVSGRFEDYYRFTAPISGYTPKHDVSNFLRQLLTRQAGRTELADQDDDNVLRAYWTRDIKPIKSHTLAMKNYLTGVALGESLVTIGKEKHFPPFMSIVDEVEAGRYTSGFAAIAHSYNAPLEPQEIAKQSGSVYVLEVYLIVALRAPRRPLGVSLWYCWNPVEKVWMPQHLLQLDNSDHRNRFIF